MKNILNRPLFFILIMSLCMFSACFETNGQPMRMQGPAADFTLEGINGEKVVLSDILKTKIAVLIFWATWCPYCRSQLPQTEKFYLENKDKIAVIGIDVGESKAQVERFLRRMKISYPIVLDTDARVVKLYNLVAVPTIVAVDKNSKIIYYGHSTKELAETVSF